MGIFQSLAVARLTKTRYRFTKTKVCGGEMATNIKDIAREAGVSMATVSLVFNRKPGVGKETRERVLRVAKDLDYRRALPRVGDKPKGRTVRFLKISRHGHTVNRDHDSFIADYIAGLDQQARLSKWTVEVNMFASVRAEETVRFLSTVSADGAIVLGTELAVDEVSEFMKAPIPVVILDTYYGHLPLDFVDMSNEAAAFTAISHLVEHGHREIGFIKGNSEVANFRLREQGYVNAMKQFGLKVNAADILPVDSTFDGAYRDMAKHLADGGKLPPALFISNDIMAYGAMKAMKEAGIRVPEDMSVVGFNDIPFADRFGCELPGPAGGRQLTPV
jgi:LacI family transcriptional regulator